MKKKWIFVLFLLIILNLAVYIINVGDYLSIKPPPFNSEWGIFSETYFWAVGGIIIVTFLFIVLLFLRQTLFMFKKKFDLAFLAI